MLFFFDALCKRGKLHMERHEEHVVQKKAGSSLLIGSQKAPPTENFLPSELFYSNLSAQVTCL